MKLANALPLTEGFLLGAGLIAGIGPQNTLVLRQGLRRKHLFLVFALCILLDALLIILGTLSVGNLVAEVDWLERLLTYSGMVVLLFYGGRSFQMALKPTRVEEASGHSTSQGHLVLSVLAVSLLNPSVYLDTLVVIGGAATQHPGDLRWLFASGAILASLLWFFALSYGAAALAPLLKHPSTLRLLDALSGGVMWFVAFRLLQHSL